jgi:hypothetical protein
MIKPFAIAALVAAISTPLVAQQAPPAPAKPDAKTDAKPAPALPGKWAMSVDTPNGGRQVTMTLALEGKKVTGTLVSDEGETALAGEYVDNKLSFAITMEANGSSLQIGFTGAFKDDGSLAGTMDFGQGAMNWTAQRMKEKG